MSSARLGHAMATPCRRLRWDSTVLQRGKPFFIAHVRTASNLIDYFGKNPPSRADVTCVDVNKGQASEFL